MKILIAFGMLLASSSFARGGGEGPCPVPDLPFPEVASKTFLGTSGVVQDLQLFDEQQTLLVRQDNPKLERKRFGDSVVMIHPESYAVFLRPGKVVELATLNSKVLPVWTDRIERVSGNLGAVKHAAGYDLVSIAATGKAKGICRTPAIRNLRLAEGGSPRAAYFYSWTSRRLRIFRQETSGCKWSTEAVYRRLPRPRTDKLVWLEGRSEAFYLSARGLVRADNYGFKTFDLAAKQIYFLAASAPSILVRTQSDSLALFSSELEKAATLLRWTRPFTAEEIAYSEQSRKLFVPLRLESDNEGLYVFTLH